jgi:hypothetical protein
MFHEASYLAKEQERDERENGQNDHHRELENVTEKARRVNSSMVRDRFHETVRTVPYITRWSVPATTKNPLTTTIKLTCSKSARKEKLFLA